MKMQLFVFGRDLSSLQQLFSEFITKIKNNIFLKTSKYSSLSTVFRQLSQLLD